SHNPTMKYDALSRMKAQPPANFVRNNSEREIGLLSNRSMAPASNVCGIIDEVTRIAANTPSVPTKKLIIVATIPLMTVSASLRDIGAFVTFQPRYETESSVLPLAISEG